ncbi:MAG TPA: hypothetical protein PKD48_01900 [Sphingopyxis sp.]|nr:hypothetical protein [Sphingopyxis sp.]
MLIKIDAASSVPGGKAIVLCDDNGSPLPMQSRVVLSNGVDEMGEITVTFVIDGERVRFAD